MASINVYFDGLNTDACICKTKLFDSGGLLVAPNAVGPHVTGFNEVLGYMLVLESGRYHNFVTLSRVPRRILLSISGDIHAIFCKFGFTICITKGTN